VDFWIFGISFSRHAVTATAESRLRKKAAIASDYAQSKSAVMKQNPQALKLMLADDHDAAVHLAFRPYLNHSLGTLKKLDQAKEMISSSGEAPDKKQAAIDALDKARELEVAKADRVDQAVDMVLKRVHQRRGTGLDNLPFLRSVPQLIRFPVWAPVLSDKR
jgi:hypothetical protein